MLGLLESEEKMVKEYQVVSEEYLGDLEDEVHELIKSGWEPQGGLCVREFGFYQAMILKEKE